MEIQDFSFEDRKLVLYIIIELFNGQPQVVAEALYPNRVEITEHLFKLY
jgi:hypothetical protein